MFTWENIWTIVSPIMKMAIILIVGHFVIVYLLKLINRGFSKAKLDESLARFLSKAINIVLHILIILSALNTIGISTSGILAALSAAAVAVAVALKDSLSNVAGGILLLISPRFSTGDYIDAGGDEGTVLAVDLLHTTVLTVDCRQVSIPNGVLINDHITNYSREHKRRVDITFSISYEANVETAKKVALETILQHPLVLREPDEPFVRVRSYEDSSVNLITRTWCRTEDYWDVYFDLMEQVRAAFEHNGIRIPYTQLDVHIKESKTQTESKEIISGNCVSV